MIAGLGSQSWQADDQTLEHTAQVSLVFANVAEEDILLREELEDMAAKHKRFKVGFCYCCDMCDCVA